MALARTFLVQPARLATPAVALGAALMLATAGATPVLAQESGTSAPMPLIPPANQSWGPAPGETQGGLRPDERQGTTPGAWTVAPTPVPAPADPGTAPHLPDPSLPSMPPPREVTGAAPGAPVVTHGSTDPQWIEPLAEARATVAKATATVSRLRTDSGFKAELNDLLARARAVMIVPRFLKAGFVVGGAFGSAVLLVRDDQGTFSDPSFHIVGAGSVGLQIGAQENEIILLIMTDDGLQALLRDKFKLEAGASVTFGIVGGGVSTGSTTDINQDVIAFSHSRGLFGGGALEGAIIEPQQDRNTAYYDSPQATPEAIVLQRRFSNPTSAPLKQALVAPL